MANDKILCRLESALRKNIDPFKFMVEGYVWGHPGLEEGSLITTSPVLETIGDNKIVTKEGTYLVNWAQQSIVT